MIIECSVQKVIRFNVKETLAYYTLLFSLTWTQSLLQYIYVKSISDGLDEVSERVKIKILDNFSFIFYHPPTKLRGVNVFTDVCLSFCSGGSHVTITHDALDLTVHPPTDMGPHSTGTSPAVTSGGHHWRPVQTCSLQNLPPPVLTSGDYWSMYVWRKWAVSILVECFLVKHVFKIHTKLSTTYN